MTCWWNIASSDNLDSIIILSVIIKIEVALLKILQSKKWGQGELDIFWVTVLVFSRFDDEAFFGSEHKMNTHAQF